MARQLIGSLSGEFDPSAYRDEYREELLALIERKAKGETVTAPEAEAPKPTRAPDLMAALEESLAAVQGEPLAAGGKGSDKRKKKAVTRGSGKKAKSKSTSSSNGSKSSGSKKSRAKSGAKSK